MEAILALLGVVIWLSVVLFLISLVIRLVRAVERIADSLDAPGGIRLPDGAHRDGA